MLDAFRAFAHVSGGKCRWIGNLTLKYVDDAAVWWPLPVDGSGWGGTSESCKDARASPAYIYFHTWHRVHIFLATLLQCANMNGMRMNGAYPYFMETVPSALDDVTSLQDAGNHFDFWKVVLRMFWFDHRMIAYCHAFEIAADFGVLSMNVYDIGWHHILHCCII